ncbi:MBL fold metallo-hydrolase [Aquabacterium sp. A7-Y]|uniref:MBL fold metallo-hydrolase n=1 Tax=Aquabacterium sp. A7-Y TaxID=1349605 RepID=UPI00223E2CA0|nr:MBL fold metallo-hydrolase [Aquabacterium sp. A7-Y]MCW7541284.1 MBL fold metallo-hydrolase [Aquabacterium sp. A7-Y]
MNDVVNLIGAARAAISTWRSAASRSFIQGPLRMSLRRPLARLFMTPVLVWACSLALAANKDLSREKIVDLDHLTEVSPGVHVIEDKDHVVLVPNVTLITGKDAVLVVDTGLGTESARRVLQTAERLAKGKRLYLTTTHFHPEHGFGAHVFKGKATLIYNRAQRDELLKKGPAYRRLFSERLGVAEALKDMRFVLPDIVYEREAEIDLGGRVVRLSHHQPAHTLGDQVVSVPAQGVVILGDLLETKSFPIFPWFPEIEDTDVDPVNWREILQAVERTQPKVVIPGHGPVGTARDLTEAVRHMDTVRDEVTKRCSSGQDLASIQKDLTPLLRAQHPDWELQDWIANEILVYHTRLCGSASELGLFDKVARE